MKYEEIKVGEKYLYKGKKVKVSNGFKEVKTDLKGGTRNHYKLHLIANGGLAIITYSNTGRFEDLTPLKPKLPETGLVVMENWVSNFHFPTIVMRTGKDTAYGFRVGKYESEGKQWSFETRPEYWRPATEEDKERWKELLIEEVKRRGYKEGVTINEMNVGKSVIESNEYKVIYYNDNNLWCVRVDGWSVFKGGKFAKIIEDPKECETKNHFRDALIYTTANMWDIHHKRNNKRRPSKEEAEKVMEILVKCYERTRANTLRANTLRDRRRVLRRNERIRKASIQ